MTAPTRVLLLTAVAMIGPLEREDIGVQPDEETEIIKNYIIIQLTKNHIIIKY